MTRNLVLACTVLLGAATLLAAGSACARAAHPEARTSVTYPIDRSGTATPIGRTRRDAPETTDPSAGPGGPGISAPGAGTPRHDPPVGRRASTPGGVLRRLGTQQVALTFDDGPDAATPQILTLLRQYGVKATFCLIGVNVQAHPDLVRQIVADGHSLCNHTWRHDLQLGTRGRAVILDDLQRTNDEIHRAAPGTPIRYFRHPAGNFTTDATAVASSLGMLSIGWDVDPRDWDLQRYGSGAPLTRHIADVVTATCRSGSIVLSHDGGSNRSSTVAAYQTLIPWLKARYELVPLPT